MKCPDCQRDSRVVKTVTMGFITYRERSCECGTKFHTRETLANAGNIDPTLTTGNGGQPPPTVPNNGQPPLTTHNRRGTIGGSSPSSSLSLISSASDPNSNGVVLSNPDQTRARKNKRGANHEYPAAFEVEWDQTAKGGSKDKACYAWERLGRPKFGESWQRWTRCPLWNQEWYNYPNVSSWLNDGRYKQDPSETIVKSTARIAPSKADQNLDVLDDWLASGKGQ